MTIATFSGRRVNHDYQIGAEKDMASCIGLVLNKINGDESGLGQKFA